LREEWETTVKEAADELAAKKFLLSQPSYPNGTLGPLDPHTTRAAFDWQETLGQGTYGVVSKVRETSTGTIYAQKVIRVTDSRLRSRVEKEVLNEVSIMQKLRHHHIASVQFYVREADTFSIIMLPVADCDLLHFLQRRCIDAQFPRSELAHLNSWFGCLVGALAFAHSNDIKHEDIKPSNILIKGDQPFLADFGCAKDFSGLESSSSIETLTFGTPVYWAPESHPRGRSADIFSLGCVFTEMLTVRHGQTLEDYQAFRYLPERDNAYAFRENLSQVLRWLENLVDPKDSVGTLLKEETLKMLEPDKTRRKTAKEIKRGLRLEGDIVFCSTCF
jgi:serine/threonine protein kinase